VFRRRKPFHAPPLRSELRTVTAPPASTRWMADSVKAPLLLLPLLPVKRSRFTASPRTAVPYTPLFAWSLRFMKARLTLRAPER
jgi:hypothetical protein